ncbi:MAG: SDR family oxidoreductase [Acidobacteria bacterium]|nr:SDR family oxidoreductase [Acidobacteriota bacterium]
MGANRLACITGASSGIGAEFARQLAARGYDLLLVARREERLRQLAATLPVECECLPADLSIPSTRHQLAERLRGEARLQLLVNNAGFGSRGLFWESDLPRQREMHEVHVMTTVDLTHAALANMVAGGSGGVINVASVASFAQSRGSVSYCATKSWMLVFTEAIALELRGAGSPVRIQALCPGFTYSEFHDVIQVDRTQMPSWLWMHAVDVVRASLQGLDQDKLVVVPGLIYRLMAAILPRLPRALRMALQSRNPHARGRV